jgi:hypothetical protein
MLGSKALDRDHDHYDDEAQDKDADPGLDPCSVGHGQRATAIIRRKPDTGQGTEVAQKEEVRCDAGVHAGTDRIVRLRQDVRGRQERGKPEARSESGRAEVLADPMSLETEIPDAAVGDKALPLDHLREGIVAEELMLDLQRQVADPSVHPLGKSIMHHR